MKTVESDPSTTSAVAKLRLPHPYLTTYYAVPAKQNDQTLKIQISGTYNGPHKELHRDDLSYLSLQEPASTAEDSNNSIWARARRSYTTTVSWKGTPPTLSQLWLIVYMIFTQSPDHEYFRLSLNGDSKDEVTKHLKQSTLAIDHPRPSREADKHSKEGHDELLVLRSTFWQGAASPFGQRSVWIPEGGGSANVTTVDYTMTTKMPEFNQVHAWHPRRATKPAPGAVIYSRYVPTLDEHFSMQALDYENPEHLNLFHTWQNDPRVAAGWNETGDLTHHKNYLRNLHEDPHVLTVLAYWDDTPFAYFEIYWAAEDHLGAHYQADGFDRGRHALVGNPNFRGRHRVTAWWSATMHYIFLDDPRTMRVVGEPKYVNTSVLAYDLMHGFGVQKFVDLGHKRSALMICPRERYFQLGMDGTQEGVVGGTRVAVGIPKL
ncbi:hypothetical protein LTR05_006531 [Lithohypha guttulata]|uniref:Acyltransferase MbtK/IucB-like conserved domain-containing protein n=1 Tax=Lithohypha guttulata TaxID=1690604 RepID=A0AAN7SVE4_9EURO|nr:hypothetical protein LTR05_006531 [Lithohypha guttulata]